MKNSRLLTLLAILIIPIMLTSCPPTPKPGIVDDGTGTSTGTGTDDTTDTTDDKGTGTVAHTSEEIAAAKVKLNKLLGDLYFDYNRSTLRPLSKSVLKGAAEVLKEFHEIKIKIEGHCDNRGTVEYNLALGERRSNSAQRFLKNLGVSRNQISTISYGEDKPQCNDDNEVCWQKNRRAHFKVR